MPASQTAAATRAHVRNAALRSACDPQRLARALRTVKAAIDLGIVSHADVLTVDHEPHQRQGAQ